MLEIFQECRRRGAGPNDIQRREVAIDPDSIHRMVPTGDSLEGKAVIEAVTDDGETIRLVGTLQELVRQINAGGYREV